MADNKCYPFLGCNNGFFGYDAVVHAVYGIWGAILIIWLMEKFPSISLLHNNFWKNFLIVVSVVLLIGFSWEFYEFCHDQFFMKILHENITTPNRRLQPSNDDTMGDLTFSVLCATITASLIFHKKKKNISTAERRTI